MQVVETACDNCGEIKTSYAKDWISFEGMKVESEFSAKIFSETQLDFCTVGCVGHWFNGKICKRCGRLFCENPDHNQG